MSYEFTHRSGDTGRHFRQDEDHRQMHADGAGGLHDFSLILANGDHER